MTDQQLIEEIQRLKQQRNAVILAHNYQCDEVQALADFTGDSLGLSITASRTDADVIVFCGVHFMAETASILCPGKTILMPDPEAGCPMANMITADQVRRLKREHPGALVVAYVNTSADVKAETDICCTSSNALKVVASLPPDRPLIFIPDKYLGSYISSATGRDFILWNGYCPTHVKIRPEDIQQQKESHPDALVLAHPECTAPVVALADKVLSTEGICRFAQQSEAQAFIIATEIGVLYRLRHENPGKTFYPATDRATCPNMKKTTLEKVLWSLERMQHEVKVPDDIREKAYRPVAEMIRIA